MRTITIGFSRPTNRFFPIFSWLIRLYLRTPYSHVYLKFYSKSTNRYLVYESVGGGVRFIGWNVWKKYAKPLKEFELLIDDDSYSRLIQYCIDNSGKSYDLAQNFGIVLANLFNLDYNPLNLNKNNSNCSEEIANILRQVNKPVNKQLDLVTPKDIWFALHR